MADDMTRFVELLKGCDFFKNVNSYSTSKMPLKHWKRNDELTDQVFIWNVHCVHFCCSHGLNHTYKQPISSKTSTNVYISGLTTFMNSRLALLIITFLAICLYESLF